MKDLSEVSQYLVINITREDGVIKVDQKQYTKDILKRFDVLIQDNEKRLYTTLMERKLKFTKTEGKYNTTERHKVFCMKTTLMRYCIYLHTRALTLHMLWENYRGSAKLQTIVHARL